MTSIVYRDGVLASDTLISDRGSNLAWAHTRKIVKSKSGWLAGAAGSMEEVAAFLDWVKREEWKEDFPKACKSLEGILIDPNGKISYLEGRVNRIKITDPYVSVGSGTNVALGALYMGATAIEAVNAAIYYCIDCGGDVIYEKLSKGI